MNNFVLAGHVCECDLDYRCDNHDERAEALYYGRQMGFVK
jgi:hypothetical protein